MKPFSFDLIAKDGAARAGVFHTPHGELLTPIFAPVGTQATVKAITPAQLEEMGASLVLSNAYHLYLRPGADKIAECGGLHKFMAWEKPILTDSGGFQIFSQTNQRKIDADGVDFRSHIDGSSHRFTPEKSIAVQESLGADIIMAFDECPNPHDRTYNEQALARTHAWAERCLHAKKRPDQALFGIVQGGIFPDLREQSAEFITALGTPGVAIGGLSVGETKDQTYSILDYLNPILPEKRPRYLMGVGSPDDIVEAILRGVDIMDCVLPTRMARNHAAITLRGQLNLRNAIFAQDQRPIDSECTCYSCRKFTRAYLRHLIVAREMLAATLISIHNLHTLIALAKELRQAIIDNRAQSFVANFRSTYQKRRPPEL